MNDPFRTTTIRSGEGGEDTHPEDVCECGDYRRQHDDHGCILCRNFPAPTGRCLRFRLFRSATRATES